MQLVAENLKVALGGRPVVGGISLALGEGKVTGLLGPNGAGKTTLLRTLAGQQEHTGAVQLDGRSLAELNDNARARHIAWLPQARIISWPLTVENTVALGRLPWHGWRRVLSSEDREICNNAMQLMDIEHLQGRLVTELSGGEQARVLLARAVAQDTPILLADEPSAGLDPSHQIAMMEVLQQLARRGRTVLVSLHELPLAARWCDELVLMHAGTIAERGTPDEVVTQDTLRTVYGIDAHIGKDDDGLWLAPLGLTQTANER